MLELLLDSPAETTLSLNAPDRPLDEVRELRVAPLAMRGIVHGRVDEVGEAGVRLREVETGDDEDDPNCDRALLAAGHVTLTALQGLREDPRLVYPRVAAHGPGTQPPMGYQVTEVQKALKGANYPMEGDQLADLAQSNGAPDDLVKTLRGVPKVDGPNGVMKHLSGDLGGSTGDS